MPQITHQGEHSGHSAGGQAEHPAQPLPMAGDHQVAKANQTTAQRQFAKIVSAVVRMLARLSPGSLRRLIKLAARPTFARLLAAR